jgi:hypothetical protein
MASLYGRIYGSLILAGIPPTLIGTESLADRHVEPTPSNASRVSEVS